MTTIEPTTNAGEHPSLHIVHIYPQHMNMYGDWGNVLTLVKRGQWHGYSVSVTGYNPGDQWPDQADLVIGGGGQDSGQNLISGDLLKLGSRLHQLADDGVPMLMICGMYQLFGNFFETTQGMRMEGIGIFNSQTVGGTKRMIGNTVITSAFGELIGYENHSGVTTLGAGQQPLGQVVQGAGNNGRDRSEGARTGNVFGTYLHGSLLPKNPVFADALLREAALRKYGQFSVGTTDDTLAARAREVARHRPR